MQYQTAILALAASSISAAYAQNCSPDYPSLFEISPKNVTANSKREILEARQAGAVASCTTEPVICLSNGILIDQDGRQGEIVANRQFQFDKPLQAGAKHTDGFGVCTDSNTLSSQGSDSFYACNSGSFSNLYDQSIGKQCYPVHLVIIPCAGGQDAQNFPSGVKGCSGKAQSAPAVSSAPAATSAPSTEATEAASTPSTSTTPSSIPPYQPTMPAAPPVSPAPVATPSAPFPLPNNGTTPVATGSAAVPPTTTSAHATFTGAAANVVAGGKIIAGIAGLAAYVLA